MPSALRRPAPLGLVMLLGALVLPPGGAAQTAPQAFDGSFRLETGEVLTGGVLDEGGGVGFLYMDTSGLARGGLFEAVTDTRLRSVFPAGIEIEFLADAEGGVEGLVWREDGGEPIRGSRVFPHRTRDVAFTSADGTAITGRLLVPECPGPHPVVVSVSGSGPGTRFAGTHHTFFLAHGVAVLAYDKRGPDAAAWREPDLADLSADAAAAVRYAATLPEIDPDRIGLMGHSQGGWIVPPATLDAPETDFLILRAGAALTHAETSLFEVRQELRAAGLSGVDLDQALELRHELYRLAMAQAPISAADAAAAPYLDEPWYALAFGEGPLSANWSAWWWAWSQRNQAVTALPALAAFHGPVLWFLAEQDENVPLVATRAGLERAFAEAPGDDHEVVVLAEARHSFLIPTPDGSARFAEGYWTRMGEWMAERGIAEPACAAE